jgi:U3 small nucleolar RNA-associated protein 14
MHRRKSSVAPSLEKSGPPKPKAKRSQNALAIAERQAPVRSKIRQNRLGQSEPEINKRKKQDQDEDSGTEGDQRKPKRRKEGAKDRYGNNVEYGSDSSGNEWTVGLVEDDDDSDIDSDEAMADSDDDGAAIRGSLPNTSVTKRPAKAADQELADDEQQRSLLRESNDEEDGLGEESDSFGEDAVDLSAMLDASDDGEGLSHMSSEPEQDGEEFPGSIDNQETDVGAENEGSVLSYSGDEDSDGDPAKLASLQALVATMNEQDQGPTRVAAPIGAQESTTPSEFGLSSKRKLTVADLVPSITDPKLRQSLKLLVDDNSKSASKPGRIPRKLEVPLPRRQQDRLDRAAAYEKSKETLNRWIDTVKHNRRAEHLSFPLKASNTAANQGSTRLLPTTQTQPLTDLESTIQNILQDSGLAVPNGRSEEDQLQAFEELKTNKMPFDEVQARRAELRRARELLFREEIRSKRIKKIKSKTYRKVHRKERERNAQQDKDRLTEAGIYDSESEQERKDRRRAEERMGARHRESRWAKGVKDSGRAKWDEDARGGVTEMARRGEELRRRIEGKAAGEDDEDSESEGDDDDEHDVEDVDARDDANTTKRLRKLDEREKALDSSAMGSRLASMDFMKNAEAARKARNNADVESLRRDLAGEGTPSEEGDEEGQGRKTFGPAKGGLVTAKAPQAAERSEFEERQDIEPEAKDGHEEPEEAEIEIVVDTAGFQGKPGPEKNDTIHKGQRKQLSITSSDPVPETNQNIWLMPDKKGSNVGKKRVQESSAVAIVPDALPTKIVAPASPKPGPRSALKGARKAENASKSMPGSTIALEAVPSDGENDDDSADKLPFVLRNQDLIRKGFAGDEVVAQFEAEKRAIMEDEEDKIVDNTLPGWGSWTGAGIGKKAEKRNKNKVMTKQPGIAKEKRKDAKLDRVIINEKRVKKIGKYLASSLPHPFETRQQYQRSLRMPIGPEFQTLTAYQDATKPRILMKQGIIAPMAKPMI